MSGPEAVAVRWVSRVYLGVHSALHYPLHLQQILETETRRKR